MSILQQIDARINSITMYRIVLYGLFLLAGIAVLFGFAGLLSYGGLQLLASLGVVMVSCGVTNMVLARLYSVPANTESWAISGLILFFVLAPVVSVANIGVLAAASVLAMASKYIFAIRRRHIANPVAIALVVLGLIGSGAAIWWVGNVLLAPFVAVIGAVILRKTRRAHLFVAFVVAALATIGTYGFVQGAHLPTLLTEVVLSWPLLFFATVMLTEPLTAPPTQNVRLVYGVIVGVLFGSQFHLGPLYATPEFALVIGNIFAYVFGAKQHIILTLQERVTVARDTYEFIFHTSERMKFIAGQYAEWTLAHGGPDSRGNRRYFTIASSPNEEHIRVSVRMNPERSSSFKTALAVLPIGGTLVAGHVAGDFTLPHDQTKKMIWIAGGIGITPFRSMAQYVIDQGEQRDVVLFYAAAHPDLFAYQEVFTQAEQAWGLRSIRVLTGVDGANPVPKDWSGKVGFITPAMLKEEVPDFLERRFYLSGPHAMVHSYEQLLRSLEVKKKDIVTDYFPGF